MRAGEDLTARRSYGQVCPIAKTLDVIGDRWTLLIIRDMLLGAAKFKDFLERQPAMPARILSDRLKKLEAAGIIERRIYSEHPLRAEYHLTRRGEALQPVLLAIGSWGLDEFFDKRERRAFVKRLAAHGIHVR